MALIGIIWKNLTGRVEKIEDDKVNRDLCDERHVTLNDKVDALSAKVDTSHDKMDELKEMDNQEKRLQSALERVRKFFHFIIIDCPPSLGFLTLNALAAADSVLVPVQCEFLSMERIPELFRIFDEVRTYLNPSLALEGVLLTMYDERTNLSKQVAQEVRDSLEESTYKVVIPRNVRLAEAPSFGKPILLYDIKSKGAQAYLELAREILKK